MNRKTLFRYGLVTLAVLVVLAAGSAGHALGAEVGGVTVPPIQKSSGEFVPIVGIPGVPLTGDASIGSVLNGLFRIVIVMAGLLAVIYIVIGGFEYMVSGARAEKKDGKERIQSAVIGLILLLSSYIILNVINPDILDLEPFRTTLTPAPEQQGPAAAGGANTGGGTTQPTENTGQTPQQGEQGGGETSSLPAKWRAGIDSSSLSELKSNYNSTCTNPDSPFYQGAEKCRYVRDRVLTLAEASQVVSTTEIGKPAGGWHAYEQYTSKQDLEAGAAACRADGRTPHTFGSSFGERSCRENSFSPFSSEAKNPGGSECMYRFKCVK